MALGEKQQKRLQFQEQFQDGLPAAGGRKHADAAARKRAAVLRTYEEPLLPKLTKILFISMLVLTGVMVLVEVRAGVRSGAQLGMARVLRNLSLTALVIWLIYSVLLGVTCGLCMRQNAAEFYRKQRESGLSDGQAEDRARSRRAIRRLNKSCRCYLLCSLVGAAVWALLFLAVRLF